MVRHRVHGSCLSRRRVEEAAVVQVRGIRGEAAAAVAEERGVEPELQPAGRVGRSGGPGDASSVAGGDGVEGRREVRPERRGREAALPPPRGRLAHPLAAGGGGGAVEVEVHRSRAQHRRFAARFGEAAVSAEAKSEI